MAVDGKMERRPHQDWHYWYRAWRWQLDPIVDGLRVEKRLKDSRGAVKHPRRIVTLRAQVRMLLRIRRRVRQLARAEEERGRAAEVMDTNGRTVPLGEDHATVGAQLP